MAQEFFYSESTGLYISRQPLRIDNRVAKAADECAIPLQWDDEGRINLISFEEACLLLQELGSQMISPRQYWQVLTDAEKASDRGMVGELTNQEYAEWLGAIFEGVNKMTENPKLVKTTEGFWFQGQRKSVQPPFGRPGWIELTDIDSETGLPTKAELNRERLSATWKYWSVTKPSEIPVAPIRGAVTSASMPSLDLDIPTGARQPKLLVRECRQEPLAPLVPGETLAKADEFIRTYEAMNSNYALAEFSQKYRDRFLKFVNQSGFHFQISKEMTIRIIREKFIDIFGLLRLAAIQSGDAKTEEAIGQAAQEFADLRHQISESFTDFVINSRQSLKKAFQNRQPIVFVVGHKNPDSDTVISCLTEAYRNYLVDDSAVYVPVLQNNRVPDEVRRLIGDALADTLVLSEERIYQEAANSGWARWILVDHNKSQWQKFAIAIIDHHMPCQTALRQNIAKSLQMIGSCTSLIVQKYQGLGMDIPKDMARIMLGAALMDTENRSRHKMTPKDDLIMDYLKQISGVKDEDSFYQDLMSYLLNSDDAELLFARDYKEDWGLFGFAVAKVMGGFSPDGQLLKADLVDRLLSLAQENSRQKNFPLTVVKFADYKPDKSINRERFYFVWNEPVGPEFKKAMVDLVEAIIRFQLKAKTRRADDYDDYIDFWDTPYQLSRKRTAPLLEPIVAAFTRWFYSPSTSLYVKREFLEAKASVKQTAINCGLKLYWDKQGRVNNITFSEVKTLLGALGLNFMTLRQYWQVRQDALRMSDVQITKSLHAQGFVEFLNTIIEDRKFLIDDPVVSVQGYQGKRQAVEIPVAEPGLIRPEFIDPKTGVPQRALPPENYEDRTLWRYWSPDAYYTVATRSHILLIDQTSLDFKLHPTEALPCLGVRPCSWQIKAPQVVIQETEDYLAVIIKEEGETLEIRGDLSGRVVTLS